MRAQETKREYLVILERKYSSKWEAVTTEKNKELQVSERENELRF